MTLSALSFHHANANIALRGALNLEAGDMSAALQALKTRFSLLHPETPPPELAMLSTCNRLEIYCAGDIPEFAFTELALAWLAEQTKLGVTQLQSAVQIWQEEAFVNHLFRVACGMDSMVLGEPEILGQLKNAYQIAQAAGTLGPELHALFQNSFATAKQIRTQTAIGQHAQSFASVAVKLTAEVFEEFSSLQALFIGVGPMIAQSLTHFAAQRVQRLSLANRTRARAQALANPLGAQVLDLSKIPEHLHEFDVVITCTASPLPILGVGAIKDALARRKHRPMLLVDMAVPCDIESQVRELEDAYLYNLDDLGNFVRQAQAHRSQASIEAQVLVDAATQRFLHRRSLNAIKPFIRLLQTQAELWGQQETRKALKRLQLGEDPSAVLKMFATHLSKQFLHGALTELKGTPSENQTEMQQLLAKLFLRS